MTLSSLKEKHHKWQIVIWQINYLPINGSNQIILIMFCQVKTHFYFSFSIKINRWVNKQWSWNITTGVSEGVTPPSVSQFWRSRCAGMRTIRNELNWTATCAHYHISIHGCRLEANTSVWSPTQLRQSAHIICSSPSSEPTSCVPQTSSCLRRAQWPQTRSAIGENYVQDYNGTIVKLFHFIDQTPTAKMMKTWFI